MLTELYDLSTSLQRYGLSVQQRHQWVKPLKKQPAIIIRLDESACVKEAFPIAVTEAAKLWKIEKDYHNSFPAFNLKAPLFEVPCDHPVRLRLEAKDATGHEKAALLRDLITSEPFRDGPLGSARLQVRLQGLPLELLPIFEENSEPGLDAFRELLRRVKSLEFDIARILKEAGLLCIAALETGESSNIELVEQLLIGKLTRDKKSDRKKVDAKPFTGYLDVAPHPAFSRQVAHAAMGLLFDIALLGPERKASGNRGVCSLGAHVGPLISKFPNPKLPELGNTFLFSMNKDALCHDRYGWIGASISPVGQSTGEQLNSAVLWITAPERKNKTWRPVPRDNDDDNDLLIVYLREEPTIDIAFAAFFTEADDSEELEAGKAISFEMIGKTVFDALSAKEKVDPDATLCTLVLRQVSIGQVQVELSRQYPIHAVKEGFQNWRDGSKNLPSFPFLFLRDEGATRVSLCPSPAAVARITRVLWLRAGTHRTVVSGVPYATVLDAFLDSGKLGRKAIQGILERLVPGCGPLLLNCGHGHHRGKLTLSKQQREECLSALSVLGIVLFKLQRPKEIYMKDPAFLIGRFLSLSDVLHKNYCDVVRGGGIPPQLAGNSLIPVIDSNPQRAFAICKDRMRPYYAWAQTVDPTKVKPENQKSAWNAKWALREMKHVAAQLEGRLQNKPLDDAQKAELFLGYLAWVEAESVGKNETNEETSNA